MDTIRAIKTDADLVNRPPHYNGHPSGIEDLQKAKWYIERELKRRDSTR